MPYWSYWSYWALLIAAAAAVAALAASVSTPPAPRETDGRGRPRPPVVALHEPRMGAGTLPADTSASDASVLMCSLSRRVKDV